MKSIYILLTKSETILSKIVHLITNDTYTHVSISFDQDLKTLYTSSRKNGRTMFPAGPCLEHLEKGYLGRHPEIPCAVYELQVTEETYEHARQEVACIMDHADDYHFNIIGLMLCHFHILLIIENTIFSVPNLSVRFSSEAMPFRYLRTHR